MSERERETGKDQHCRAWQRQRQRLQLQLQLARFHRFSALNLLRCHSDCPTACSQRVMRAQEHDVPRPHEPVRARRVFQNGLSSAQLQLSSCTGPVVDGVWFQDGPTWAVGGSRRRAASAARAGGLLPCAPLRAPFSLGSVCVGGLDSGCGARPADACIGPVTAPVLFFCTLLCVAQGVAE